MVNGSTQNNLEFLSTSNFCVKGGHIKTISMLLSALFLIFFICNTSLFAERCKMIVNAKENGSATGSTTVLCGDTAYYSIIQAFPDKGYMFSHWSDSDGDVISSSNPSYIYIVSDTILFANFIEKTDGKDYFVGVIGFNSTGSGYYDEGDAVILTAIPDLCFKFLNWVDSEGNFISEENPIEIIVANNDTMLYVNYEELEHHIWVEASEGGTTTDSDTIPCGFLYTYDTVITVGAIPDEGYIFSFWSDENGDIISTENPLVITTLTSDMKLIANFVLKSGKTEESFIKSIKIIPNPTKEIATITFDLETAGNLNITLTDLLGNELFELHNEFTQEGTFSKTFSLETFPVGVYYIKITHNGNVKIEKLIRK